MIRKTDNDNNNVFKNTEVLLNFNKLKICAFFTSADKNLLKITSVY